MSISSRIRALCFGLLLGFTGSCSNDPQSAIGPESDIEASKVDFATLLTTSDPVDVCTAKMEVKMSTELGPDFLPENYERLSCLCLRDTIQFQVKRVAPDQPMLQTVLVQITMNMEIRPFLFDRKKHPGGMEAFWRFMKRDGKDELGFDDEALRSAMWAGGKVAAKYQNENAAWALLGQLPSCVSSLEMGEVRFPGTSRIGGNEEMARIFAAQRLKHNPDISITAIE